MFKVGDTVKQNGYMLIEGVVTKILGDALYEIRVTKCELEDTTGKLYIWRLGNNWGLVSSGEVTTEEALSDIIESQF